MRTCTLHILQHSFLCWFHPSWSNCKHVHTCKLLGMVKMKTRFVLLCAFKFLRWKRFCQKSALMEPADVRTIRTYPSLIIWNVKLWRSSMCFRRAKCFVVPVLAHLMDPLLSCIICAHDCVMYNSFYTFWSHFISLHVSDKVIYSASAELKSTVFCNVLVACRIATPYVSNNSLRLLELSSQSPAQIASACTVNWLPWSGFIKYDWSVVPCKYHKVLFADNQSASLGFATRDPKILVATQKSGLVFCARYIKLPTILWYRLRSCSSSSDI